MTKQFAGADIYRNFNLELREGEFVSIFGPNGCGKSTFINLISGIVPMDAGTVLYDGKTIEKTRLSYVFQNYRDALFPWMRAIGNIQYPLKVLGMDKATRLRRVEELLVEFDIRIDLNRYPYELSGGQQQTISILRALITDPEELFLDEPFSALDYEMTLFMRGEFAECLSQAPQHHHLRVSRPRGGRSTRQSGFSATSATDPDRGDRSR